MVGSVKGKTLLPFVAPRFSSLLEGTLVIFSVTFQIIFHVFIIMTTSYTKDMHIDCTFLILVGRIFWNNYISIRGAILLTVV